MTDPFASLERSLRDGPPDELGYRDRRREPEIGFGATSVDGLAPVRVIGLLRTRGEIQSLSMSPFAVVVVAAIAIGVVAFAIRQDPIVIGPAASGLTSPSPTSMPTPTARPSASPSPGPTANQLPSQAAVSIPPLTRTFLSTRNGFAIAYPSDWTARPATQSWKPDTITRIGSPVVDQLELAGKFRLVVASQRLGPGQTEAQWVAAYFPPYQGAIECANASDLPASPRITIDGRVGYLRLGGCPVAADRAMSATDVEFEAFVFAADRVYKINFDGDVDLASFEALVSTMTLDPASAIDPAAS